MPLEPASEDDVQERQHRAWMQMLKQEEKRSFGKWNPLMCEELVNVANFIGSDKDVRQPPECNLSFQKCLTTSASDSTQLNKSDNKLPTVTGVQVTRMATRASKGAAPTSNKLVSTGSFKISRLPASIQAANEKYVDLDCAESRIQYEIVYQQTLEETNKRMAAHEKKIMKDWENELRTYKEITRRAREHHSHLRKQRDAGNAINDEQPNFVPSRRASLLSNRAVDKLLTPEERIGLLSNLFTSIVCESFGLDIGVHRLPVSSGGIAYLWKKVKEQLDDLRSRNSYVPPPVAKTLGGSRRDRRPKPTELWLVSSRFEVKPELEAVEPLQRYLKIRSGFRMKSRVDTTETGSVGSADSSKKGRGQGSKFRVFTATIDLRFERLAAFVGLGLIAVYESVASPDPRNVNEDKPLSAAAEQRMSKQNVPRRTSSPPMDDYVDIFDEAQVFVPPSKRRGVSITENLVKNLLLDEVQSKDPDVILSGKIERQRRQFHLPGGALLMKKAIEDLVPESPIPLHRLTREVIKKIPVDHSNDSDYESPDLSDGGVDTDAVEAITETTLINAPGVDTILLRKCHTNLPPHREVIPCVSGVNDLPSVQEAQKTRNKEARFTMAPRSKKLRENYPRYMMQTVVPVTVGAPLNESSSEDSLFELSEGSFIERLNSDLPTEAILKSELFSDFLNQTNNSSIASAAANGTIVLKRQSRVMRRSTFRCSSRALGLSEMEGLPRLRKPDVDQTQKMTGMGPITSILFLPPPKDQAGNVLKAVGQLLDKMDPCLLSLMAKVSMSALPNDAWLHEKDEELLGMALSQLAVDLLAYRHVAGHCIRYKLLAVLETSKRNPALHNQLCQLAPQHGNWLDQLLRSFNSTYVSCRLEAAIVLIAVVSNHKLMKTIGNIGSPPLLYDIMASLIKAADAYDDSFPAFFVVMAFMLHCHQKQTLLRCVLDRGPQVRSLSITRHWPRLIAFMYTYWDHLRVVEFKVSEHRLRTILDCAWQNPLSRTAAKEAMKAIRRYTERRPQLATVWPTVDVKIPAAPMNDR